jgi:hypothetical protein
MALDVIGQPAGKGVLWFSFATSFVTVDISIVPTFKIVMSCAKMFTIQNSIFFRDHVKGLHANILEEKSYSYTTLMPREERKSKIKS